MAAAVSGPASSSAPDQFICSFKLDPLTQLSTPIAEKPVQLLRELIIAIRNLREADLTFRATEAAHPPAAGAAADAPPPVVVNARAKVDDSYKLYQEAYGKLRGSDNSTLDYLHGKSVHFGTGNPNSQRAIALLCGRGPMDTSVPTGTMRLDSGLIVRLQPRDTVFEDFCPILLPELSAVGAVGGGKRKVTNKKLSKRTSLKGGAKRRGSKKSSKKASSKKGSKKASMKGGAKRRGSKKTSKKTSAKKASKKASMKGGAKRRGSKKASKKASSKKGSKKASMKGGAKRRGSKKASKKASSKKGSKKASMKGGAKRRGSKKASKKGSKSRTTRK